MNAPVALSPVVLVLALAALLPAQEPEDTATEKPAIQSGPPAGTELTRVSVYAPTGPHQGQTFDVAKKIGAAPGCLMFVHTVNREVAPVIRALDNMELEYGILGFKSFTIRLGADRTELETATQRHSTAMGMRNPMVVSTDGIEGPGNYALNRKAYLTVVLTKNGKVHRSIAITDTGQKDVARLRKWIEEVAGTLPKNRAELMQRLPDDPDVLKQLVASLYDQVKRQAEQLQRRPGQRRRGMDRRRRGGEGRREQAPTSRPQLAGKIPDDAELQSLMRGLIQKTNTKEDVDDLFAQVDKRVGQDKDLQSQAVEGFKRLLSTTYGTDYARQRLQKYVQSYGPKPEKKKL